jgi:hypothetical protein
MRREGRQSEREIEIEREMSLWQRERNVNDVWSPMEKDL